MGSGTEAEGITFVKVRQCNNKYLGKAIMRSCSVEWHYEEACISLLLLVGSSSDFIMRVRKKWWSDTSMKQYSEEIEDAQALEAQKDHPYFSVSLCSSGPGTQSTHSPSDLIKAGSKQWWSHERLQIGVEEGSNSLVIWCDVVCGEGEKLWELRGVEIVTALKKLMLT